MNYFKVCQLSKPSLCFPVFYFTGENDFYPAANFIECKMCHFMLANSKHNSRSRVTQKNFTSVFSQNSRIAGLAVRESLSAAADSSCLITNVLLHYGCTNCQCGNRRGFSLYFCFSSPCNHTLVPAKAGLLLHLYRGRLSMPCALNTPEKSGQASSKNAPSSSFLTGIFLGAFLLLG